MRFCFRIAALAVCSVMLLTAQAPAGQEASPPATIEAPVLTPAQPAAAPAKAPAPLTPAAAASTTPQAPVAEAPAAAPKDPTLPSLEAPPSKKPAASQAAPPMPKSAVTETADGKPYVIGSLDVLYIRVWNQPNLTGMFDVAPDGMISMSLVGEVKADGLTRAQLIEVLKKKLDECCLNDPQVDVQVTKINSKHYLVVGEVGRPGTVPLVGKITIFEALTMAGVRETANMKKIYLLRGGKKIPFNYKDVLQGKSLDKDIPLEDGDRIVVPQ